MADGSYLSSCLGERPFGVFSCFSAPRYTPLLRLLATKSMRARDRLRLGCPRDAHSARADIAKMVHFANSASSPIRSFFFFKASVIFKVPPKRYIRTKEALRTTRYSHIRQRRTFRPLGPRPFFPAADIIRRINFFPFRPEQVEPLPIAD